MSRPIRSGRPRQDSEPPISPAKKTPAAPRSRTGSSSQSDGRSGRPRLRRERALQAVPQRRAARRPAPTPRPRRAADRPRQRAREDLAQRRAGPPSRRAHHRPAPVPRQHGPRRSCGPRSSRARRPRARRGSRPAALAADQEVLGQEVLERREAADRVERRARDEDGLADDARHPEDPRDGGRAGLQAAVQVEGLDPRGEADRSGRDEEVRDQAHAGSREVRDVARARKSGRTRTLPSEKRIRRWRARATAAARRSTLALPPRSRSSKTNVLGTCGWRSATRRAIGIGRVRVVERRRRRSRSAGSRAGRSDSRFSSRPSSRPQSGFRIETGGGEAGTRSPARGPAQAPQRDRGRRRVDPRRTPRPARRDGRGGRHAVAASSRGQAQHADPRPAPQRREDALAVLLRLEQRLPGVEVLGTVEVAVGQVRQALARDDRVELPAAADLPEIEQRRHELAAVPEVPGVGEPLAHLVRVAGDRDGAARPDLLEHVERIAVGRQELVEAEREDVDRGVAVDRVARHLRAAAGRASRRCSRRARPRGRSRPRTASSSRGRGCCRSGARSCRARCPG